MQINWSSRQGSQRHSNNDAAGVGIGRDFYVAVLVDAAENNCTDPSVAQKFARHWCQLVVEQALRLNQPLNMTYLMQLLQNEQRQLRHKYLHEVASYCAAIIAPDTGVFSILYCGDCLAGVIDNTVGPEATWLHQPHTLLHHYNDLTVISTSTSHAGGRPPPQKLRSTLTRSLSAKQFDQADTLNGVLPPGHSLMIASDGYWAQDSEDDISSISLTAGALNIQSNTDCDNLFVTQEHSTTQSVTQSVTQSTSKLERLMGMRKPNSPLQKYRLTPAGQQLFKEDK